MNIIPKQIYNVFLYCQLIYFTTYFTIYYLTNILVFSYNYVILITYFLSNKENFF